MYKAIEKCNLTGTVNAVSSKSYAHRTLIAAFLTPHKVSVKNIIFSEDIKATVGCLKSFGAEIEIKDSECVFKPVKKFATKSVADCKESGSTLRFCIPLACALGVGAEFVGNERLLSRPNAPLLECLKKHGIKIDGYRFSGKLTSGIYEIDGSVSSQYITGLLMALPLSDGDSELIITGEKVSAGYIDITLDVLQRAGIAIKKTDNGFYIYGNQTYNMPSCSVVGDWSNAAFFLSAGALKGNEICVTGLDIADKQGDKAILEILKKFGANIDFSDGIKVGYGGAKAFETDIKDFPDLAPIIAVLAANAVGTSVIKSVDRLRIKESDRLNAIMENLDRCGVECEYRNDVLYVHGTGKLKSATFEGYNDHRMVMSSAVLCSVGGGIINGTEAVSKSYPDFFADFEKIGGKVR